MINQNNRLIFDEFDSIIEKHKGMPDSEKDGVFAMAIYKNGNKRIKSEIKILINGFTLEQMDVVLRNVYAHVYEMRKRGDKKMQEINKRLSR